MNPTPSRNKTFPVEEPPKKRETVSIDCHPKKFLPDLLWVLKARSKDDLRETLHYLNVDAQGIQCSDGKRLHWFSDLDLLPALMPGLYDVQVLKNQIIFIPKEGEFPDYKNVIPLYTTPPICVDLDVKDAINQKLSASIANIAVNCQNSKNAVNIDFLKDLIGYSWEVQGPSITEQNKPLLFKSGKCIAVICPVQI